MKNRKLNATETAAVERQYGNLEAARAEFRRLRLERDAHNGDASKLLAEGGKVIYLAGGKFSLTHASILCGWEFAFVLN